MDYYFDCPCGHAHHEHNWFGAPGTISGCMHCRCWTYHGHRVGDEPHTVIEMGLVKPTGEMEADHKVQEIREKLRREEMDT